MEDSTLNPYYPAWAQFLIADMAFSAYDKVRIQEASDQGMQPKLDLLKRVIEKYTRAADFKTAAWTTHAYFVMGMAVDNFAGELEKLEKLPEIQKLQEKSQTQPASQSAGQPGGQARGQAGMQAGQAGQAGGNDTASLLNAIQMLQKIIEFREKARLFYQKNIHLSEKNEIQEDTWITRSRENLTENYWQSGQLYETIYSLIKEAPVPDVLDEEQVKSYRQALLEKALPYQDQAVEMYAKNTGALTNKIEYNPYIGQSYQRLAILKPDRYLREEERPLSEDRSGMNLPDQLLMRK